MPSDPFDVAFQSAPRLWPDLALLAAGAAAAILRLATYTGPARPWHLVALDALVMLLVGYALGELTLGFTGSVHQAMGAGIGSGLVGWETVKRIAARRAGREGGS